MHYAKDTGKLGLWLCLALVKVRECWRADTRENERASWSLPLAKLLLLCRVAGCELRVGWSVVFELQSQSQSPVRLSMVKSNENTGIKPLVTIRCAVQRAKKPHRKNRYGFRFSWVLFRPVYVSVSFLATTSQPIAGCNMGLR